MAKKWPGMVVHRSFIKEDSFVYRLYISKMLPIPKVSFLQEDYLIQFVEENVQPSSYTVKYTVRPKGTNGDSGALSDWQIRHIPRSNQMGRFKMFRRP